jgi:hypothetical protein
MNLNRASRIGLGIALAVLLALAAAWAARAWLVVQFAERYFRSHGVAARVEVGALGLSGATGRFALGPPAAPELAAERLELFFDPLRWTPYLVEVRLVNPLVRARIDAAGRVTLPSLQDWLNSLSTSKEKSPYVSDDLVVSFTGLRALLATPAGPMEVNGSARLVRNWPETLAPSSAPSSRRGAKRAVSVAESSAMPAQASTTTVEWPREKNSPTPVGFWPCATSLRVTLSMAAM